MPNRRRWKITLFFCCLTLLGTGQPAPLKKLQCRKVSLTYPSTWHLTEERRGEQRRYTMTPDSMQQLTMRMFEIMEIPVNSSNGYDYFKKNLKSIINPTTESATEILKKEEISFKDHRSICLELVRNSLPQKFYCIDAGNILYLVVVMERRYSQAPDPGIKRDAYAILNSITFNR